MRCVRSFTAVSLVLLMLSAASTAGASCTDIRDCSVEAEIDRRACAPAGCARARITLEVANEGLPRVERASSSGAKSGYHFDLTPGGGAQGGCWTFSDGAATDVNDEQSCPFTATASTVTVSGTAYATNGPSSITVQVVGPNSIVYPGCHADGAAGTPATCSQEISVPVAAGTPLLCVAYATTTGGFVCKN